MQQLGTHVNQQKLEAETSEGYFDTDLLFVNQSFLCDITCLSFLKRTIYTMYHIYL